MSAMIYKWIIVYEGGRTEEKYGSCPADFADDILDVPIAIIREGWGGDANEINRCNKKHI